MITFHWPWLFVILPLPWLLRRLLRPVPDAGGPALRVPFLEDFSTPSTADTDRASRSFALWAAAFAWMLLLTAAAQPLWIGDPISLPRSGRDLMLAVDLSGSMAEEDFQLQGRWVDRLTATKGVAGDFIEHRRGDRLGLILFGDRAYLQAPLTFDRKTVHTLLDEAEIGLAGKATAIGDAIGLAVKRLRDLDQADRVLVLITDGANTAGEVAPLEAARLAAREGLKIYTIGIGADEIMVRGFFGMRRMNPSAELDERTLRAIAQATGGRYFRARDTAELQEIYTLLDRLEPVQREEETFRPRVSLYPWPLGLAVLVASALLAGPLLPGPWGAGLHLAALRRRRYPAGTPSTDTATRPQGLSE